MMLMTILSAVFAHQVFIVSAISSQCGFRYVENPEIPGVCCNPRFNCDAGNEIVRCRQSFENDTCQRCPAGYVQPDMISSFDKLEVTKCFRNTSKCLARDSTYSREKENGCHGKNGCKCDTDKCYYDDYCVCTLTQPCGVNEELDPDKKECVPCKEFTYKPTTGCSPCKTNVTAWIIAMEKTSAVLTPSYKSTTTPTTSKGGSGVSSGGSSNTPKTKPTTNNNNKNTGVDGSIVTTNSSLSVGPVLENPVQDDGASLEIIIGILIPLMLLTIILSVILFVKCRNNRQGRRQLCFKLFQRENERRGIPAANGHAVRYDPVPPPEVERNGNVNKDNSLIESSLSTFHPIDSVPNQPNSVNQTPQCNHYAAQQNEINHPQTNNVVHDQSASITPPQSGQFDTNENDSTPLVKHGNQPLMVKIPPFTNTAASLRTPTPTKTSLTDDSSGKIATPTDHDSRSEMVPSASPFQMSATNHPLSGATYDGTRVKEVSPTVNVVKPFVKYDSGCFSTATERLSSAAQSNNFHIRRPPDEGENDTEVKRQPDSHEGDHEDEDKQC